MKKHNVNDYIGQLFNGIKVLEEGVAASQHTTKNKYNYLQIETANIATKTERENIMLKVKTLTQIVKSNAGVVFLMGKAGIGKSAICAAIAKENGWNYVDLRTSQMDEVDISGLPTVEDDVIHQQDVKVMTFALPKWFVKACRSDIPTLVAVEELNRATASVQNAMLEILNERTLHGVKLPDNVYLIATGNTGSDGCYVEEMDAALRNRLVLLNHDLTFGEWSESFANDNVSSEIMRFLNNNTQFYYSNNIPETGAFATPRSWTNLSRLVEATGTTFGEWLDDDQAELLKVATGYVGSEAAAQFVRYLSENRKVTLTQLLDGAPIEDLTRTERVELLHEFEALYGFNFHELKENQRENMLQLIGTVDKDVYFGYWNKIITFNEDGGLPVDPLAVENDAFVYTPFSKWFIEALEKHPVLQPLRQQMMSDVQPIIDELEKLEKQQ